MCQIPQVYFLLKFDETTPIYNALGDILVDAQEFHRKSFPLAKPIQRFVFFMVIIKNNNDMVLGIMLTSMLMRAQQNIIVSLIV